MLKIGRNRLITILVVLCGLMQVAAMMPHHHHAGSEVPCINFLHLSESISGDGGHDCSGGCGCDAHDHDHAPFTACNTHILVIAQPKHDVCKFEIAASDLPDSCRYGFHEQAADYFGLEEYFTVRLGTAYRLIPDSEPLSMRYLSRVRSPRAPDFVA